MRIYENPCITHKLRDYEQKVIHILFIDLLQMHLRYG